MRRKAGNLAMIINNSATDEFDDSPDKKNEISNVLQTTLDLHTLLGLFSEKTHHLVPHDGYVFKKHDSKFTITSGTRTGHSCHYRIVLEGQKLGTVTLIRSSRFKQNEISLFESFLCCLVYPLRNALLYRQAMLSARTDALTGALNQGAFKDCLGREGELARRQNTPLSMIMVDIDHFKLINDQHGHQAGDKVLKTIAETIKTACRKSDIVFRYGGEEFIVVLSNTSLLGATMLAERIRQAIESTEFQSLTRPLNVTASLGVASLKTHENPDALLQRVDQALYQAKISGRNRIIETH